MTKYFDYSPWISPVTGKIHTSSLLPSLPYHYIFQGDPEGNVYASSEIIDINLDILHLNQSVENIQYEISGIESARPILQSHSDFFPDGQPLDLLHHGILSHQNGVVETAKLGKSEITIHNPFDPDNPFKISSGNIWQGGDDDYPEESNVIAYIEGDLAFLSARLTANFIIGSGNLAYKTVWPAAQFLDRLGTGAWLKISDEIPGKIEKLTLTPDQVMMSDFEGNPTSNQTINTENLPTLPFDFIWQGDVFDRPEAVFPLFVRQAELAEAVEALELQIAFLEEEIAGLYYISIADGVISLGALLTSLFNRANETEKNIENIQNNFQNSNYVIYDNLEESIVNHIENHNAEKINYSVDKFFKNSFSDFFERNVQTLEVDSQQISLLPEHILIGSGSQKAIQVPINEFNFLKKDIFFDSEGDVIFFEKTSGSFKNKIIENVQLDGSHITIPVGISTNRPANPHNGMLRMETDL